MITHDMLEEARQLADDLRDIKEREMTLRLAIAEELGISELDIGTHNFSEHGFKIKLKKAIGYGIVQDEYQELLDSGVITEAEQELVRIKYDLKLADYKKADYTENLNEVIVVKPAAPSLTIVLGE